MLLVNEGQTTGIVQRWVMPRFTAPILLDQDGYVGQIYSVTGIPRLFVVDRSGWLVYAHAGCGGGLERNPSWIVDQTLTHQPGPPHG